jgi:hypothetical protein
MKTNLLNFLKSNLKYIILVGVIIALLLLNAIKKATIKRQIEKINSIEMSNFALNNDRSILEAQINLLKLDFASISFKNDSLKIVLKKYQKELIELSIQHKKELEALLKIPNDTIFVRLQPLYPNYDNTLLVYPFSGSQIRGIYSTSIKFNMLQQEYSVQGKGYNACLVLNDGFEKGILNLNKQILNLNDNIGKADLQIKGYDKEVTLLNRKINRQSFWTKSLIGGLAIAVGIVLIK